MSVAELVKVRGQRCAWRGCTATTPLGDIPKDWRWLCLWWGKAALPPWNHGNIEDRDCVLCPEHVAVLHGELLEPLN